MGNNADITKLKPIEHEIVEGYIDTGGNVSATARRSKVSRARVVRVLEKGHVRDHMKECLAGMGVDPNMISKKILEGLDACTTYYSKAKGGTVTVPDYETRRKYLEMYLKLQQVDMSGRSAMTIEDQVTEFSDEELRSIIEDTM